MINTPLVRPNFHMKRAMHETGVNNETVSAVNTRENGFACEEAEGEGFVQLPL